MTDSNRRATIAERIREARKLAGLSQTQVAKMLDIPRPSVSEIEAGRRRVSADEAAGLAGAFQVDLAWLLGETDEALAVADPRIALAARELGKLSEGDIDRLLTLLAAIRHEKGTDIP